MGPRSPDSDQGASAVCLQEPEEAADSPTEDESLVPANGIDPVDGECFI